jgi:kynurenine formamidase
MSADHSTWLIDVAWPKAGPARIYDLAQQMYTGIPHHPNHPPYGFTLTKRHGEVMYPNGVSAAAEMITTGGHVGTHIDGLAHVSILGKVYEGVDIGAHQSYGEGMTEMSVHELSPIAAPGHLVDATLAFGRALTPQDGIDAELLQAWFREHSVPEPGSVVLVRTGWDQMWEDNAKFLGTNDGAPGITLSGAEWLIEHGIVATGADTVSYERIPSPSLEVHCHLLIESGVPIMEAMNLASLANDERWEFFFFAAALSIRGGTGSPIRPLAFCSAGGVE